MSNQYNSIAELFTSCPFDNTYAHTLEPMSIASKLSWLESNAGYTASQDRFTQLMLVKLDTATDRGTLKLTCLDSKAFSYNYAYIHNKNGSYFCFITGCRYINDATQGNTSTSVYEFDLEIDVLMTYLLSSSQLKDCMVARQHAEEDVITYQLVPEPVTIVNYKKLNWTDLTESYNLKDGANAMPVFGLLEPDSGSGLLDGVFSGLSLRTFSMMDPFGISSAKAWLKQHAGDEDVIFGYMLPKSFVEHFYSIDWSATDKGVAAPKVEGKLADPITIVLPNTPTTVDGYEPKNKKLLTFPYTYRTVTDGNGSSITLKNEQWTRPGTQHLHLYFVASPSPSIRIVPKAYENSVQNNGGTIVTPTNETMDVVLTINDFPMVSWTYSAFDQWLSRSLIGSTAKSIMNFGQWSRDNLNINNHQSLVNLLF